MSRRQNPEMVNDDEKKYKNLNMNITRKSDKTTIFPIPKFCPSLIRQNKSCFLFKIIVIRVHNEHTCLFCD
ncbi:hypothetical protein BpHYR1_052152 [Brachionus plicatilis]|uniref:Uncharacterized protein n=1 Tax=Brachionus plicatilis TaxID=10195 RepID=A0A3M7R4J6_BRAPC|nr:hypothetical protein BpHYR1_052152 [Brachionus plicatilis]